MPQTLPNGIKTPINSDAYNLTADLALMGGSANVVQKVANGAAMAALTSTTGDTCIRLDLPGAPVWTYNGTAWSGPGGLTVANLTFPGPYASKGSPYPVASAVRTSGGLISLQGTVTNTSTATIASNTTVQIAQLAAGYFPSGTVRYRFNGVLGTTVPSTDGYVNISTAGAISVFLNSGVGSPPVGNLTVHLDGITWVGQ